MRRKRKMGGKRREGVRQERERERRTKPLARGEREREKRNKTNTLVGPAVTFKVSPNPQNVSTADVAQVAGFRRLIRIHKSGFRRRLAQLLDVLWFEINSSWYFELVDSFVLQNLHHCVVTGPQIDR
ncbi:hypothetical protein WMY93_000362 [Mugilogobius chulae]|uniref:Protein-tyrosine phosphatase receptor IA-2 ectodomain domain-containing protein n=1 Tax=Mugilogobius chulae TaxID=88201 RepID=A0AAW0PZ29_9GOBI